MHPQPSGRRHLLHCGRHKVRMWEGAHALNTVGRGRRVEGWEGVRGVGGHETSLGGGQERGGRKVGGKEAKEASGVQDGDAVAT